MCPAKPHLHTQLFNMPDSCRRGQSTRSRQREQEPRYLGKDYEEKRREGQAVGGIAQGLGQVARVLPRAANQPAQRPEDAVDEAMRISHHTTSKAVTDMAHQEAGRDQGCSMPALASAAISSRGRMKPSTS
ncbi:hypothetical protein G6O67_004176 [Ophiocordyceps sinensis]|uniref:Uncharacterized protein n=1 Tax=Ophiocordyceps sinensis TaxID=72228 RepID=A0A8H4LY29_9HYPO|nr:hypothetical protein G6O67_004176 [Ophiocordyceps sinensis]